MAFQEFLVDAESLRDQANEASSDGIEVAEQRYAIASILFSCIAIESFINDMMADFSSLPEGIFAVHEQGFLQERAVQFASTGQNAGKFVLTDRPEYRRLEDKVLFLLGRVAGRGPDKGSHLWQRFDTLKQLRDGLTHPRKERIANVLAKDASEALDVAKTIIRHVADEVWRKPVHF